MLMTTPLVVDRRTGGRDATGKLAIAPRGTPGISHPPSAWRNSWCDELATLMRRPAGCRYRRRSPDCARRAARDPIEERSHSRTSGRLSRVGPIQRWMQPTQTAAGAPDAARQTGGQPGSLPRPRNLGSHAWSLSRARGFRLYALRPVMRCARSSARVFAAQIDLGWRSQHIIRGLRGMRAACRRVGICRA